MIEKERVDAALVDRGLFISREKAQAAIMAGQVYIGERKVLKPSESLLPEDNLILRKPEVEYVSRGALKLEKAVRIFHADMKDKVVLDIGASTGGFTDVCLRNGARKVFAVDVGYGQLDWSLRNDPRVIVMERTNARYLTADMLDEIPDITVMDVSFISIRLILPTAVKIMGKNGVFFTLIKPQFEAGRGKVGKKGVVRDAETHEEVLNGIVAFTESIGWRVIRLDFSPITGPEGNIEFLAEIRYRENESSPLTEEEIHRIVTEAHQKMRGSI